MKKILIIGIGAGDPDYVTMQAVKALNRVDVFFVHREGRRPRRSWSTLRREICRRYIEGTRLPHRRGARARRATRAPADYGAASTAQGDERAVFER